MPYPSSSVPIGLIVLIVLIVLIALIALKLPKAHMPTQFNIL